MVTDLLLSGAAAVTSCSAPGRRHLVFREIPGEAGGDSLSRWSMEHRRVPAMFIRYNGFGGLFRQHRLRNSNSGERRRKTDVGRALKPSADGGCGASASYFRKEGFKGWRRGPCSRGGGSDVYDPMELLPERDMNGMHT